MDFKKFDRTLFVSAAVPGSIAVTPWLGMFLYNRNCFTLTLPGALLVAGAAFCVITLLSAALLWAVDLCRWKERLRALFTGLSAAAIVQYYGCYDAFDKELLHSLLWMDALLFCGVYLLLLGAPVFLALWQTQRCYKWRLKIALVLLLTQLVSLGYACISSPPVGEAYDFREYSFSEKDKFTFGSKENIIVLVVDCMGERLLKEVLVKYPGTAEIFRDFTCFDRMTSPLPKTMYAVPALLTGINFPRNEKGEPSDDDHAEYLNRVCREESSLLKLARSKGFRTEGYPFILQTISYAPDVIDNSQVITQEVKKESVEKITEIVLSRFIPAFLKGFLGDGFVSEPLPFVTPGGSEEEAVFSYDQIFYRRLQQEFRVGEKEKIFKYLHISGAHDPLLVDENLVKGKNLLRTQQLRGSLKIVALLLEKLKAHKLYDASTIVITGDHTEKYKPEVVTFIKRPFEKPKSLIFNSAPCQISQIAATVARESGLLPKAPSLFGLPFVKGSVSTIREDGSQFAQMTPWKKLSTSVTPWEHVETVQGSPLLHDGRIMVDLCAANPLYSASKATVFAENLRSAEKYVSTIDLKKTFRDLLLPPAAFPEGDYLVYIVEEGKNHDNEIERTCRIIPPWYHVSPRGITAMSKPPELFSLPITLNRKMIFHSYSLFPGVRFSRKCTTGNNGVKVPSGEGVTLHLPPSREKCTVQIRFQPLPGNEGKLSIQVNGKERGKVKIPGTTAEESLYMFAVSPDEPRVVTVSFHPQKKKGKPQFLPEGVRIISCIAAANISTSDAGNGAN